MKMAFAERKVFALFLVIFVNFSHGNSVDPYQGYFTTDGDQNDSRDQQNTDQRNTDQRSSDSTLCRNIQPQLQVNMDYVTGQWYGNEILMHTQDVPGVHQYDSCVIIHLSDVTQQMQTLNRDNNNNNYNSFNRRPTNTGVQQSYNNNQHQQQQQQHQQYQPQRQQSQQNNQQEQRSDAYAQTKYLRMVWSEREDNLEYTFNYTDYNPGVWHNVGDQRGNWVNLNQYKQFKGTVQVVKAVNDHLVLTFCGSDQPSTVYTIVLSRRAGALSAEVLKSIRNLLAFRGIYSEAVRKVCASGAAGLARATSIFTALLGVLLILRKYY